MYIWCFKKNTMATGLLKGKKGIIFGALDEDSIAWKVAVQAVAEGAEITLTNAPIAMRMGKINELAAHCNAKVIPADATSEEDLENLFKESMEALGGKVDFVLHSSNKAAARADESAPPEAATKTLSPAAISSNSDLTARRI